MSTPLLELTRGPIVECIHRGDIAVTDTDGNLLASVGNPGKNTYFRSAAKPIQALHLFTSGAYDHFGFLPEEIAIICSSHYAEEFHRRTITKILSKIGLSQDHILGGTVTSLNTEYALQLARDQIELSPIFSDCSGKHAGMLAACVHKGYDLTTYLQPEHPCQQNILQIIADICSINRDSIQIGIDGCSAPVHSLPIRNMAQGFARIANQASLEECYRPGASRIFEAMTTRPEMVSGTGGFCTELIRHTGGRMIGKIGAEGVYCVGIRDRGIGIAVKIENGNMAVLPPIVLSLLEQLSLIDNDELQRLDRYYAMRNINDLKTTVGHYLPIFTLLR